MKDVPMTFIGSGAARSNSRHERHELCLYPGRNQARDEGHEVADLTLGNRRNAIVLLMKSERAKRLPESHCAVNAMMQSVSFALPLADPIQVR